MIRKRKEKWFVNGLYGGKFTNLKDAKIAAKFASMQSEYNGECVWVKNLEDFMNYFTYENGKCTFDGWTKKN